MEKLLVSSCWPLLLADDGITQEAKTRKVMSDDERVTGVSVPHDISVETWRSRRFLSVGRPAHN